MTVLDTKRGKQYNQLESVDPTWKNQLEKYILWDNWGNLVI